tara:strand:+ start:1037 stop:1354 length:318 start_codon:yes stop_codon:yes gene_type:complete
MGGLQVHQAFIDASHPPALKGDLADLDSESLVGTLIAALTRRAGQQGSAELGTYRDRKLYIGLVGLFLQAKFKNPRTNTPTVFAAAIERHRKAVAERQIMHDVVQ